MWNKYREFDLINISFRYCFQVKMTFQQQFSSSQIQIKKSIRHKGKIIMLPVLANVNDDDDDDPFKMSHPINIFVVIYLICHASCKNLLTYRRSMAIITKEKYITGIR